MVTLFGVVQLPSGQEWWVMPKYKARWWLSINTIPMRHSQSWFPAPLPVSIPNALTEILRT